MRQINEDLLDDKISATVEYRRLLVTDEEMLSIWLDTRSERKFELVALNPSATKENLRSSGSISGLLNKI